MIRKIVIKNFKNFKDPLVLDFSKSRDYEFHTELVDNGLIKKVLLYGTNNSGKSNLGAAIMDITIHLTDNAGQDNPIYTYYVNGDSSSDQAEFEYTFSFDGQEIVYRYAKTSPVAVTREELLVDGETLFRYNYDTGDHINKIPEAQSIDISKNNTDMNVLKYIYKNTLFWEEESPVRKMMVFVDNMLWFRSLQHNEYIGKASTNENLHDYVIENDLVGDFEKFLADCGQNFKLSTMLYGNKEVISVKYKHTEAPFGAVVSSGTLSLWLFYYWMKKSKNISFLFLDEFDAFYHYELSQYILDYVNKESNFQSILTTHNIFLMSNELMRPDCYLILEDGKILSLADRTNKTIRLAHNLEKMYIGGEFESE